MGVNNRRMFKLLLLLLLLVSTCSFLQSGVLCQHQQPIKRSLIAKNQLNEKVDQMAVNSVATNSLNKESEVKTRTKRQVDEPGLQPKEELESNGEPNENGINNVNPEKPESGEDLVERPIEDGPAETDKVDDKEVGITEEKNPEVTDNKLETDEANNDMTDDDKTEVTTEDLIDNKDGELDTTDTTVEVDKTDNIVEVDKTDNTNTTVKTDNTDKNVDTASVNNTDEVDNETVDEETVEMEDTADHDEDEDDPTEGIEGVVQHRSMIIILSIIAFICVFGTITWAFVFYWNRKKPNRLDLKYRPIDDGTNALDQQDIEALEEADEVDQLTGGRQQVLERV